MEPQEPNGEPSAGSLPGQSPRDGDVDTPEAAPRRWRAVATFSRRAILVLAAVLSAALVSVLSIDLGPSVRALAEREGSKRLERPLKIGKLSIRLLRGEFVVEDLEIAGLAPTDRPFLRARKIVVSMPLAPLFRREVYVERVDMVDWAMVVESWPGNRNNFPKFRSSSPSSGPSRFKTTVQLVNTTGGELVYEDHATPWATVARNLQVTVRHLDTYRGEASFSNGTVKIQSYGAMRTDLKTEFEINGSRIHLSRIDLETDGSTSDLTGDVDISRWPEMLYQVKSRVHFPPMREIFFASQKFTLFGDGDFVGTFHVFKGGREVKGNFTSEMAGVNDLRFPNLRGSLVWGPTRFDVTEATAGFYGGQTHFKYSIAPIGAPTPAISKFEVTYTDVDLVKISDFLELKGLRLSGRAAGRNRLEYPLGRFAEHTGDGEVVVQPPVGTSTLGRTIPPELAKAEDQLGPEIGPFAPNPPLGYLPVSAELHYAYSRDWIDFGPSIVSTSRTHVEFEGRTAYGEQSRLPFHVTSADWQESDRLLAGVLTAAGSPSNAIPVGGRGEFDGILLNSIRRPRIEGQFRGERMRAWGVQWGDATGRLAVENSYADVTNAIVREQGAEIAVDGRFSLGYPRRDGGQEIDARVRVTGRPLIDLRRAFGLETYPIDGRLSGNFQVQGMYRRPVGIGRATIESGVAYREPFDKAAADLRFEGEGVRFSAMEIAKGGGTVTGAAYVAWNGNYSFSADGRRLPVESIELATRTAPLTGVLEFSASGTGNFDDPRYDAKARIIDLFLSDEGIGQVTGRIGVRGELMSMELEAASPRLTLSGSGRVALTPEADAELTFRFTDTSLDPYVRAYEPRLSPFTTAVASGSFRIVGELQNLDHVLVDGNVDQIDLRLFDYKVRNDGPIQISLDHNTVVLSRMKLAGEGTQLDLTGTVDLVNDRLALRATGDANLGILQGFFRDIRSSGTTELVADIQGSMRAPIITGSAAITNGRLRHFGLPHSLEAVNGRMSFDAGGIRMDDVTGRLGGGLVRIGGRLGLSGFGIGRFELTAVGEDLRIRYPEGFRSVVDADLTLRGTIEQPVLAGTVNVKSAVWTKQFETGSGLFDLGGMTGGSVGAAETSTVFPMQYDVRVVAPSTLRIENRTARIESSAELTLRGTYEQPRLFGRAEIERGEVFFEGNRYFVTRGTIDFANPSKIEPFFDIEAETRVRVPGQTYRVVFHAAGTAERFIPELSSDPPLPTVDILTLLFGDPRDPQNAELRSLRSPQAAEQELLQASAARLLASPISSGVGRVVEQTFGVDTVVITPSLIDPSAQQSSRLYPTARLTLGKRLSDRVFLTFSRGLTSSTRDQIILLEFTQSDRLSWIVSQNEDRTYAVDFRVRHTF